MYIYIYICELHSLHSGHLRDSCFNCGLAAVSSFKGGLLEAKDGAECALEKAPDNLVFLKDFGCLQASICGCGNPLLRIGSGASSETGPLSPTGSC